MPASAKSWLARKTTSAIEQGGWAANRVAKSPLHAARFEPNGQDARNSCLAGGSPAKAVKQRIASQLGGGHGTGGSRRIDRRSALRGARNGNGAGRSLAA